MKARKSPRLEDLDLDRGYISHLELENFKSYSGKHIIGPFLNFTCIIGPNGSGKSNLMDSISFALGLKARELRAYRLETMIFNYTSKKKKGDISSKGTVRLFFITEDGDEIVFSRTVNMKGTSTFRINNKTVRQKQYIEKLASYDILVEARNFLIFQGDVEGIASKSAKEMALLLEKVSGSIQYKKEYDAAKLKMEELNDVLVTHTEKFKSLAQVHNQFKKQSREAQKYEKIQGIYEKKILEHVLWRLYHVESELKQLKNELDKKQKEGDAVDSNLQTQEDLFKEQQSKLAKLKSEYLSKQKDFEKYKKAVSNRISQVEKMTVQEEHLQKEIQKNQKKLKTKKNSWKKKEKKISHHEGEIISYDNEIKKIKAQFTKEKSELEKEFSRLSDEDLKEYRELKKVADLETLQTQQEVNTIISEKERSENLLLSQKKELQAIQNQKEKEEMEIAEEEERLKGLTSSFNKLSKSIAKLGKDISTIKVKLEADERTKKDSQQKIENIRDQLRDSHSLTESFQREIKVNQAVESMKQLFDGCFGRISDCYKLLRDKYAIGVSVALGIYNRAIITDTETCAMECINYLKEQRIRPMIFLPLDSIETKRIHERIRDRLSTESKLIIDIIQPKEDKFQKAINFVFQNSVICKDLKTARKLAFGKLPIRRDSMIDEEDEDENDNGFSKPSTYSERFKVVTFKGSVIHKSGLLTGGDYDQLKSKIETAKLRGSQDTPDISKLEEERDHWIDTYHQTITEIKENEHKLSKFEDDSSEFKKRCEFLNNDIRFAKANIKRKRNSLQILEKNVKSQSKKISEVQKKLALFEKRISEKNDIIREAKTKIFEDFQNRCDVEGIEIYDERNRDLEKQKTKKLSDLEVEKSQIQNILDYLRNDRIQKEMKRISESLKIDEEKLSSLEGKKLKIVKQLGKIQKKGDSITASLKKLQDDQRKQEHELASLEKLRATVEAKRAQFRKSCLALELRIDQLRNRRVDICRKSELREIDLPFVDDTEKLGSIRKKRKVDETYDSIEDEDEDSGDEEMGKKDSGGEQMKKKVLLFSESFEVQRKDSIDEEGESTSATTASSDEGDQNNSRKRKRGERKEEEGKKKRLDFRDLNAIILNKTGREYDRIENELIEEIEELKNEMKVLAPSIGHTKKQEDAKKKKKESEDAAHEAKEKAKLATENFEEIKGKRYSAFMKTFEPVQDCIDDIYKELTKSVTFPLGGTAVIGLEDSDEPYNMGIKYHTMPPTKRYRKMEQLSGGEKTLAALALLFAIHHQKPSPFFVLDEIDASLDAANVNKVANYIRTKSEDCQFIVISLKESFYYFADALVGVHSKQSSSAVHTLDLRRFDKEEEEDDGEVEESNEMGDEN